MLHFVLLNLINYIAFNSRFATVFARAPTHTSALLHRHTNDSAEKCQNSLNKVTSLIRPHLSVQITSSLHRFRFQIATYFPSNSTHCSHTLCIFLYRHVPFVYTPSTVYLKYRQHTRRSTRTRLRALWSLRPPAPPPVATTFTALLAAQQHATPATPCLHRPCYFIAFVCVFVTVVVVVVAVRRFRRTFH